MGIGSWFIGWIGDACWLWIGWHLVWIDAGIQ